ncbi:MAG TPA: hypothetical protein VNW98_04270 [Burkholderiaceae bacterium]|jgi:hypothetical protein|nr:hypothetical protein [Burkholderiaceae bacterium]
MATKRQAGTVSLSSLSKAIDKAMDLAAKRYGVEVESDNLILNWHTIGRAIRVAEAGQTNALDAAASVARAVGGNKAQAVVTKLGRQVFIGVAYKPTGLVRF